MPHNTYLQTILSYFTSMDIAKLRLYLKDEYTYEDTTKEKFLNGVEEIFEAHRNSGDTALTWSVVQTRIRKPYLNFEGDYSESKTTSSLVSS